MQVSKQIMNKSMGAVLLLTALAFIGSTHARAAQIVISGGDAGDGWTAPASTLFAYNMGLGATDTSIQGVNFVGWTAPGTAQTSGAITIAATATSVYAYGGDPVYGGSTDDIAMGSMINKGFFNNANSAQGPLTFTITGLTVGASYRVDAFTLSGDGPRVGETFTFNGVTTDSFTMGTGNSWLVQNTITAVTGGSGGQIVLDITSTSGGTPILSGIALSLVPEPSSITLLCISGFFAFGRARGRLTK